MLLLTEDGIYAARDRLGRTPVIIGKKEGAYAATSETCALPNLGFEVDKYDPNGFMRAFGVFRSRLTWLMEQMRSADGAEEE